MASSRLVPDPSIGVSDLLQPLSNFMQLQKTRHLQGILQRPQSFSWKTSPHASWLAHLSSLMLDFAQITPTLVLSSKKVKMALSKLNDTEKINYTKKDDQDFYDWVDDTIRLACKQYRDLKNEAATKERTFRKASPTEIAKMESVLEIMQSKIEPSTSGKCSQFHPVGSVHQRRLCQSRVLNLSLQLMIQTSTFSKGFWTGRSVMLLVMLAQK